MSHCPIYDRRITTMILPDYYALHVCNYLVEDNEVRFRIRLHDNQPITSTDIPYYALDNKNRQGHHFDIEMKRHPVNTQLQVLKVIAYSISRINK